MHVSQIVKRIVEELYPAGTYLLSVRRKKKESNSENILNKQEFAHYCELSEDDLGNRLKEEHKRASTMDEKTSKLTVSFSIVLTLLGSSIAFLKSVVFPVAMQATLSTLVNALVSLGLFYCISAGLVALGALRTLPLHGYGTQFLLKYHENKKPMLAECLARQETINLIRHLRNETAFQSLRNGLLLFILVILMFVMMFAYQIPSPSH